MVLWGPRETRIKLGVTARRTVADLRASFWVKSTSECWNRTRTRARCVYWFRPGFRSCFYHGIHEVAELESGLMVSPSLSVSMSEKTSRTRAEG